MGNLKETYKPKETNVKKLELFLSKIKTSKDGK